MLSSKLRLAFVFQILILGFSCDPACHSSICRKLHDECKNMTPRDAIAKCKGCVTYCLTVKNDSLSTAADDCLNLGDHYTSLIGTPAPVYKSSVCVDLWNECFTMVPPDSIKKCKDCFNYCSKIRNNSHVNKANQCLSVAEESLSRKPTPIPPTPTSIPSSKLTPSSFPKNPPRVQDWIDKHSPFKPIKQD